MILKPPLGSLPDFGSSYAKAPSDLWLMNEGSGNIIQDLSGNENTGTFGPAAASPTWVAGNTGPAINFDGSDQYIGCGVPFLGSQLTGLTVRCVVNTASLDLAIIMENGTSYQTSTFYLAIDSNVFSFALYGTLPSANYLRRNGTITPTLGVWYDVVGVWRPGLYPDIYINSVLDNGSTDGALLTQLIDGNTDLEIGHRPVNGLPFTGKISTAEIWPRALSTSEIEGLHIDPFYPFRQEPIELWSAATAGGATETLNAGSVANVNGTWADSANIIGQYDVATATLSQTGIGDYSGDALLEDTANTPTAVNHFKIIYWNSGAHIDNDIFTLSFYDLDSTSWIEFSNYGLGAEETEYVDGDFLTDIQTKFAAAANKKNWINAFAVRWSIVVLKGADGIVISTQGIEMEIEYTPSVGIARSKIDGILRGLVNGGLVR